MPGFQYKEDKVAIFGFLGHFNSKNKEKKSITAVVNKRGEQENIQQSLD